MKLRRENNVLSLLQSVVIAMQTYDRVAVSMPIDTYDRAAPRNDNTVSPINKRISLIDSLGRSLSEESIQNSVGEGINNTQRSSDNQGESDGSKKNDLNTSCQPLSDSDVISFSESENNDVNTSCQSL